MGVLAEELGTEAVVGILLEASDEMQGRSKRKWGVIIVALVLGAVLALVAVKVRSRSAVVELDEDETGAPLERAAESA